MERLALVPLFLFPARLKSLIGCNKAISARCIIEKGRLKNQTALKHVEQITRQILLSALLALASSQFDF